MMPEIPHDNVVVQLGEHRLVWHHDEDSTFIQHHCDNKLKTNDFYCDPANNWYYCWEEEKTCAGCGAPTPPELIGLRILYEWER